MNPPLNDQMTKAMTARWQEHLLYLRGDFWHHLGWFHGKNPMILLGLQPSVWWWFRNHPQYADFNGIESGFLMGFNGDFTDTIGAFTRNSEFY
jgi:hypothetical protein